MPAKKYYEKDKEKYKAQTLTWRRNNPDRVKYYSSRQLSFHGKQIYVGYNPRVGKCSECGYEGQTVIHHAHEYDPIDVAYGTKEICIKCHAIIHKLGNGGGFTGRKHSEAAKEKIRFARLRYWNSVKH